MMEEEEFIDLLIDKYEEKQKLLKFLEQEGSILAEKYRDKNDIFRIRNVTGNEMD